MLCGTAISLQTGCIRFGYRVSSLQSSCGPTADGRADQAELRSVRPQAQALSLAGQAAADRISPSNPGHESRPAHRRWSLWIPRSILAEFERSLIMERTPPPPAERTQIAQQPRARVLVCGAAKGFAGSTTLDGRRVVQSTPIRAIGDFCAAKVPVRVHAPANKVIKCRRLIRSLSFVCRMIEFPAKNIGDSPLPTRLRCFGFPCGSLCSRLEYRQRGQMRRRLAQQLNSLAPGFLA